MFRRWCYRKAINKSAKALDKVLHPGLYSVPVLSQLEGLVSGYNLWLSTQLYLSAGIDPRELFGYDCVVPPIPRGKARDAWCSLIWGAKHTTPEMRSRCRAKAREILNSSGPLFVEHELRTVAAVKLQRVGAQVSASDLVNRWHNMSAASGVAVPAEAVAALSQLSPEELAEEMPSSTGTDPIAVLTNYDAFEAYMDSLFASDF